MRERFDDIFSLLDTIHQRDRQTDGRTSGHSKDRAYALISRTGLRFYANAHSHYESKTHYLSILLLISVN